MSVNYENFIKGLGNYFYNKSIREDEKYIYILFQTENSQIKNERMIYKLSKVQVVDSINRLSNKNMNFVEGILYNDNYYEFPVEHQNRLFSFRGVEDEKFVVDEHGLRMSISLANVDYCIQSICSLADRKDCIEEHRPIYASRRYGDESSDLSEFCYGIRQITLKLESKDKLSIKHAKKYVNSYLFNVAYLNNIVFIIKKNIFERDKYRKSIKREGQLFPYKQYNNELLRYYYQATSSEAPFSQYLAYYHVAEFYFQSFSEQDMYKEIHDYITRPSFSPSNNEEIKMFYNRVKKKMNSQRADGVWDEKTGLLLTLKKYVPDLEQLKKNLQSIDASSIEYYRNSKAEEFTSEGKEINFDYKKEELYKCLRDRIYAVRNSIVHSKEGEKLRYEPFKHDKELFKELPLIRVIAEEIIINSAKTMDL